MQKPEVTKLSTTHATIMSEKESIKHASSESAVEEASLKSAGKDGKGLAYGGDDTLPPPPTLSAEEERRLWRKIDWHIMPIVTVMYLCSFVDRSNIGKLRAVMLAVESLTGGP